MQVAVNHCYSKCHRDIRIIPDPSKPSHLWEQLPDFDSLLKDLKRWESMPNKQDPLTKAMVYKAWELYADAPWENHNQAIIDWFILGLHTGHRCIEWAQEKEPKTDQDFQRVNDP